jgi:aminoglycoside 2''-phosphotransferase
VSPQPKFSAERIRHYLPDLVIESLETNSDGQMNDVLIVNQKRVFRFAKDQEWIRDCLQREGHILRVVRKYVEMPVPVFDIQDVGCVSYQLIPGQGLTRTELLSQPEAVQDALAEQLALFLQQLHAIPQSVLEAHDIPSTNATQSRDTYLQDLEDLEREVLPHASSHVRGIIRDYWKPLQEGCLDLSHTPTLIHADLGQQHILFDAQQRRITGVLDWGVAGIGDPAHDYGVLLSCYGETLLRRMGRFTSKIAGLIERARFMALIAEASWVLRGLRSGNLFWFTVSLGTARDIMPIGSGWPGSQ